MSIIGNSNGGIVLSPSSPNVTITGVVTGNLPAGDGAYAAVQGGAAVNFNVLNVGTVSSLGDEAFATGIFLGDAGLVRNQGTIAGNSGVLIFSNAAGGYVENAGLIQARAGYGVYLAAAGGFNNTGEIFGGSYGLYMGGGGPGANTGTITGAYGIYTAGASVFDNDGVIRGERYVGAVVLGVLTNGARGVISGPTAVALPAESSVINYGQIAGGGVGVAADRSSAVYNYGVVTGAIGVTAGIYTYNNATIAGVQTGIVLTGAGAQVINAATGTIGGATGLAAGDAVTLYNYGVVIGGVTGSGAGANLYNYAGGLITAAADALSLSAAANIYNTGVILGGATAIAMNGGVVANYGTIAGTRYAIAAAATSNATLVLYPGAVISGQVYLGGGAVRLLAGPQTGSISSAQFTGVDELTLAPGAVWDFAGNFNEAVIANDGTIETAPADKITAFVLSGGGTVAMPDELAVTGLATAGERILFTGTGETLQVTSPEIFAATVKDFAVGDVIDLTTLAFSAILGESFGHNFLTLAEVATSVTLALDLPNSLAGDIQIFADGAGTAITLAPGAAFAPAAQGVFAPAAQGFLAPASSLSFVPAVSASFGV